MERRTELSSSEHEERAFFEEEGDAIAFIDGRRSSHEEFDAFSRFEFDAGNQSLLCLGDLTSMKQSAAYRDMIPTMLCYSTACAEWKQRMLGPTPLVIDLVTNLWGKGMPGIISEK